MGATLWHYTDAAGLHGIVRSNSLRLGDARFLNDRTEREYGIGVVMRVIAEEMQNDGDYHHLLAITAHYLKQRDTYTIHVCSFSELPNSISQWQRYGADGYGYCLGFASTALKRLQSRDLKLKRIIYNHKRQREAVRQQIRTLCEAFRIAHDTREESMPAEILLGTSAALSALVLEGLALELKDSSFADEREWRLIQRTPTKSGEIACLPDIQFAARGMYVKPFVDVALPSGAKRRAPLLSLICGPRLDGSLAIASASYFLRACGRDFDASWSDLHKVWR